MTLAVNGEIHVAVYIVGKKPHAAFERHNISAHRQRLALTPRKTRAGLGKAACKRPVKLHIEPHPLKLPLILGGGGRAEAYRIAEVVGGESGHNGIKINDAEGAAAVRVEQDVIYLGIVVRHANRQLTALAHMLEPAAVFLAGEEELNLRPHARRPAERVCRKSCAKLLIAHGRIVKVRYRLLKRLRREAAQSVLEMPEGAGALIEIRRGVRPLKAYAVADKFIYAPAAALAVVIIAFAVKGVYIAYHGHRLILTPKISADGGHIAHYRVNVREYKLIDPLQDVPCAGVGAYKIGFVYVAAFYLLTFDRAALGRKMVYCFFHSLFAFSLFLSSSTGIAVGSTTPGMSA